MKTFHKTMLYAVAFVAVFGIFALAVLPAADPPTPLTPEESSLAAEAAILVQSAQIQAMQAQQRFQEASERYRQIVSQLRGKHGAQPDCNLTAAQKWSCPPEPKEEADATTSSEGSDGNRTAAK